MRKHPMVALVMLVMAAAAHGQTSGSSSNAEFEAASIKINPPETDFHLSADSGNGGPGTADPGMFRCAKCTLATLIGKAFELQNYQFPGRTSLGDRTFEIAARIPAGATPEEFRAMLRNLLKDRFGLAYHYTEKKMRGYQLVVARNGSKLKESSDGPRRPDAANSDQHQFGHGDGGGHKGLIVFGESARYRGDHQTTADLARLFSDQLGGPVNDQTGLQGKYDVSLSWSGSAANPGNHSAGAWGGAGHMDHGGGAGGGAGSASNPGEPSAPNLFDAVQAQLGLRLIPAEQATTRVFVIDHVEPLPTAN